MKISEVMAELEKAKKEVGDVEVYQGGGDYTEQVRWVFVNPERDPYVPKGKVWIR